METQGLSCPERCSGIVTLGLAMAVLRTDWIRSGEATQSIETQWKSNERRGKGKEKQCKSTRWHCMAKKGDGKGTPGTEKQRRRDAGQSTARAHRRDVKHRNAMERQGHAWRRNSNAMAIHSVARAWQEIALRRHSLALTGNKKGPPRKRQLPGRHGVYKSYSVRSIS